MAAMTPDAEARWSRQSDLSAFGEFLEEDVFKCIMLGDSGVGKTTLFTRITTKERQQQNGETKSFPSQTTVVADVKRRNVLLSSGLRAKMDVWDTAGLEKLRSLTDSHYRGAKAAFLVYDSNSRISIKNHLDELRFRFGTDRPDNVLVFLLANKIDLGEDFALTEGAVKDLSARTRVPIADYFRVSGLTGQGVEEAVRTIAQGLLDTRRRSSRIEPRAARKTDTIRVQAAKPQPPARKRKCQI